MFSFSLHVVIILIVMTNILADLGDDLIVEYLFPSDYILKDSSGYGIDAIQGDSYYRVAREGSIIDDDQHSRDAARFSNDQYLLIDIPSHLTNASVSPNRDQNFDNYTVCLWMKSSQTGLVQTIVGFGADDGTEHTKLLIDRENTIFMDRGQEDKFTITDLPSVQVNHWSFLCMVVEADAFQIYHGDRKHSVRETRRTISTQKDPRFSRASLGIDPFDLFTAEIDEIRNYPTGWSLIGVYEYYCPENGTNQHSLCYWLRSKLDDVNNSPKGGLIPSSRGSKVVSNYSANVRPNSPGEYSIFNLYLSEALADVRISSAQEGHFPAHKCVLAANSKYFQTLFYQGNRSKYSEVPLDAYPLLVVRTLLEFFYRSILDVKVLCAHLMPSLELAASMESESFLTACSTQAINHCLKEDNYLDILNFAQRNNLQEMKRGVLDFIRSADESSVKNMAQ